MATQDIDFATIIAALLSLNDHFGQKLVWAASFNNEQQWLIKLLEMRGEEISRLHDLSTSVEASTPHEIKITATVDKTIRWPEGTAQRVRMNRKGIRYPAFKITSGCSVYEVQGYDQPLIEIVAANGDRLCIMMHPQIGGKDVAKTVFSIIGAAAKRHSSFVLEPEVKMPCVDFNVDPDISFMIGAGTIARRNPWYIGNAQQHFKLRMNEHGARAVARSEVAVYLGCSVSRSEMKREIIVNQPFVGWFTGKESSFPLAMFFADIDSWKSSGSLEQM